VEKDEAPNIVLQNGDVVVLPIVEDRVFVVGEVKAPGPHDFRPDLTPREYVALAGGPTNRARLTNTSVTFRSGRTYAMADAPPLEPGVSRELARWRARHYADVRYALDVTVAAPVEKLAGSLEIRVRLRGKPVDIVLDWRPPDAGALSGVDVNGRAIAKPHVVREHLVIPARDLRSGENVIELRFESPIATAGTAVTLYRDREDGSEYVYSLFVPSDASTVFPCFDQPDLKARFALALEVPAAWEAVSNAPAAETTARGATKRVRFRETEPISTYLLAFAAGPFETLDEREDGVAPQPEARLWVRKSRLARARREAYEMFLLHRQALGFFTEYFGFPFRTLAEGLREYLP